jgi:hypothetical protein
MSLQNLFGLNDEQNVAIPANQQDLKVPVTVEDAIGDLPLFDW